MAQQDHFLEIQTLIAVWKLNKVTLASKMPMNAYTFKMKIAGNQPTYKFTDAEIDRLKEVMQELSHDIEKVAGISFNKALAKVVRKKI
jgi:hypothetical protein